VTFAGHSSFLVETPGSAFIFTDYSAGLLPPKRPLVLRGWKADRGVAKIDLRVKDARIFNVPTNFIEAGGFDTNTNSIFVVEAAGLCVAHLGNLRHLLSRESLKKLGRIDVLFLSIDGRWTLNYPDAIRLVQQIRPALVIPMHYDFTGAEPFAGLAKKSFPVKVHDTNTLLISRSRLPRSTEILFMHER
jgi:L-ascorbate metabolism protein UlaG (beta-lactamase superfamily)